MEMGTITSNGGSFDVHVSLTPTGVVQVVVGGLVRYTP